MLDRTYLPLAALSLACASYLCADTEQEKRLNRLESKVDALSQTTVQGSVGSNTAPYLPKDQTKCLIVSADFFYWQAAQDGMEYAVTSSNPAGAAANVQTNGKTRDLTFSWKPGFRLGLGYNLPYDGWDIFAQWTWYRGKAHGSVHANSSRTVGMIWSPYSTSTFNTAESARAHWSLDYNVIDFELGRKYFVSRALSLRPFIGARGVFIDQHLRVQYDEANVFVLPQDLSFRASNDYAAGGLRAGFDLGWHFNRKWSFFGDLSGSIVYGEFDVKERSVGPSSTAPQALLIDVTEDAKRTKTNVEAAAGLQWETYLTNKKYEFKYHLVMRLGYEIVQWFNQNQLSKFWQPTGASIIKHHGDLGMHGVTLSAHVDF